MDHDNATAPTSRLVREYLAKNKTVIMPQPLYSLDLAIVDFLFFRELLAPEEEKHFAGIPKSAFQKYFKDFCFKFEGNYFEGYRIVIDKLVNTFRKNWKLFITTFQSELRQSIRTTDLFYHIKFFIYSQIFLPEICWEKDSKEIFFSYFVLLEFPDLVYEHWPHVL